VAAPAKADVEDAYVCVYAFWKDHKSSWSATSGYAFHTAIQDGAELFTTKSDPVGALAALKAAFNAMLVAGNSTDLQMLLGDVSLLVGDLYTDETWAGLVKARDAARLVADNAGAKQAEIDAALKALQDAKNALMLKSILDPRQSRFTRVKAAQLTVTLARGKKMTIPAFVYDEINKASKVSYRSSKPKVASVTAKGKITGKKVGKATVTVRAPNGMKVTIKVQVVDKKPAKVAKPKVTVKGVKGTMKVGGVAYANVTFKPKNAVGVKVTFTSKNKSVVSVDKAGRLLAKKKGTATIIFKAGKGSKRIKVTVK